MLKSVMSLVRWTRPRFAESVPVLEDASVEAVRQEMRSLVQQVPCAATARLMGAIERAPDLRALWFLRSPLMAAMATTRGEASARQALCRIDRLLRAGWPEAPVARAVLRG